MADGYGTIVPTNQTNEMWMVVFKFIKNVIEDYQLSNSINY